MKFRISGSCKKIVERRERARFHVHILRRPTLMKTENPEEKSVLPAPENADETASHNAEFVLGKLVQKPPPERNNASETPPAGMHPRRKPRIFSPGFFVSIAFHAVLILIAAFYVVKHFRDAPEDVPDAFVTGSGDGGNGELHGKRERRSARHPIVPKSPKIVSKSANAKIALPPVEMKIPEISAVDFNGDFGSGKSGGFGGGSGGGIGSGNGIGVGNGKNFVAKFNPKIQPKKVLGATMRAEKVAVYLDCSGSMIPYLPRVRKEIYDNYPDADIFEFDGIGTFVADGEVIGGRRGKTKNSFRSRGGIRSDGTDKTKLSRDGERIHKKHGSGFEQGEVGAWLDVMIHEKYDALAIFSDFYDGLRQYDKNGKTIFADSTYRPTDTDARKERDLRWQNQWFKTLKERRGPHIYLFTIGTEPQKFLETCVSLSEGEISDVRYLRKEVIRKRAVSRTKPADDEDDDENEEDPDDADDE